MEKENKPLKEKVIGSLTMSGVKVCERAINENDVKQAVKEAYWKLKKIGDEEGFIWTEDVEQAFKDKFGFELE